MMTEKQKDLIISQRMNGVSYGNIAGRMGMSRDAVKSYCRRHMPEGTTVVTKPLQDTTYYLCKNCGATLMQTPKMKRRVFCSDACRITWWRDHPEYINRKAVYNFSCRHCGKKMAAYGNRKYCCHACYIAERFAQKESLQT